MRQCACAGVTFERMKAAGVTSLQGAAWLFGAGAACGLCLPYIQRMLETGETEFAVIELE